MKTRIDRHYSRYTDSSVYEYGEITVSQYIDLENRCLNTGLKVSYSYDTDDQGMTLVIGITIPEIGHGKFESESEYTRYAWDMIGTYGMTDDEGFSYCVMEYNVNLYSPYDDSEDSEYMEYHPFYRYTPDSVDTLIFGEMAHDILLQEDDNGFVNSWDTAYMYKAYNYSE